MTKEEQLKQEAEENSFRYTLDKPWVCEVERKQIMAHFEKGYLAGAEPREKKIEELENTVANLKEQVQSQVEATIELDKENAELKVLLDCKNCSELSEEECEVCAEASHFKCKGKDQLTKAREIIKELLDTQSCLDPYRDIFKDRILKAEQFLQEINIGNAIQKANENLDLDKIADEVEQDLDDGCPDVLCEGCTEEDCTARKLGFIC